MEYPLLLRIAVKIHCAKLLGRFASPVPHTVEPPRPAEAIADAKELVGAFLTPEENKACLHLVPETWED